MALEDIEMVAMVIDTCGYPKVKAAWNRVITSLTAATDVGSNDSLKRMYVNLSQLAKATGTFYVPSYTEWLETKLLHDPKPQEGRETIAKIINEMKELADYLSKDSAGTSNTIREWIQKLQLAS